LYLTGPANIIVIFVGLLPAFKYILWWSWSVVKRKINFFRDLFIDNYNTHEEAFEGKNGDFIDSLLIDKMEAEEEKESKEYLDKFNIINSVGELFIVGS